MKNTIIVKNNEIVWVESYGYADIANSLQVEDTTVFLLASVSKLFTGTAAMQLHEAGTIDLDTDINNYLPWTVEIPNFSNDSTWTGTVHFCRPCTGAPFK